jgi:putative ABC transport system ATP-binding protein
MAKTPIITTKKVGVAYALGKENEAIAVSEASLEIYPGEFVIFFGPSGCGKSTLLYSIAGLERNTTGSIKVFGKEVTKMKDKELEHHHQKIIGMIFQAFYLINSLSVLQNVMLPQIAINVGFKQRKKKALELLEYFGVKSQAVKLPTELSGGQQQRIAICRALVNDPEIILADEPVGNLDSRSAQDTLRLIQQLNIKEKKTIILVTHDPSHLDIANRVFYMKDGKILNVKTNEKPRVIQPVPKEKKEEKLTLVEKGGKGAGGIELLVDTYKQGPVSGLLLDYKAKQVVMEALTGLSTEEVGLIEDKVKNFLLNGVDDHDELLSMLDRDENKGGLGMDKRTAVNLTKKVKETVKEIRLISDPPKKRIGDIVHFTDQLRYYLLDSLDIEIKHTQSVDVINRAIKERIYGYTDKKGVKAVLDLPVSKGGAGLDKRASRNMSRLLELILLGRYSKKMSDTLSKDIKVKIREVKSMSRIKKGINK